MLNEQSSSRTRELEISASILLDLVQNSLIFARNQAAHHFLGYVFCTVAEQLLQLLGVEFFNDITLFLNYIRILFVELIEAPLIFEDDFNQPPSSF